MDSNGPSFDELEEAIEVTPLHRTSIDDSNFPTPDQEISLDQEEQNPECAKEEDDPE